MKDLSKSTRLLQAGTVFLFCACMAAGCADNADKTKTETTVMEVKKDSLPVLVKDKSSTRPETIKNGGTPPPTP